MDEKKKRKAAVNRVRKSRPKTPPDLGPLHKLLVRGLPDWVDDEGYLRVYDLAERLAVSYQSLYAMMARARISPKRINGLVALSESSVKGDLDFAPLTHADFAEFFG